MARNFNAANNLLRDTTAAGVAQQGTFAVWIKPNWNSGSGGVKALVDHGETSGAAQPNFQVNSNTVYIGFVVSGDDDRMTVADTGLFSSGVWAHHVFTWDAAADECEYFVNNTSIVARTTPLAVAGHVGLTIGDFSLWVGVSFHADAHICEYARWDARLNSSERLALSRGVNPLRVRSGNLTRYHPVWGLHAPEIDLISGGSTLGLQNTPPLSNHAPVEPFSARLWRASLPHVEAVAAFDGAEFPYPASDPPLRPDPVPVSY